MKKKNLLLAALAFTALAGCSDDNFVGDQSLLENNEKGAITFGTGLKAVTRAIENDAAAALLNNNFVFMGTKGTTPVTVFNNYQARYATNSSHSSESNSNGWEYVSYYNVPGGVKANTGVVTFSATGDDSDATTDDNDNKVDQTIKYWDYGTTQYDFAAYSLGTGSGATPTYAKSSAIAEDTKSYSLTGSADELKACYISDLVTKYNTGGVSEYGNPVQFSFRSLAAKIRLAFYETIPGYSVKDVKFYTSNTATSTKDDDTNENNPTLYTSTAVLPSGSGTVTVTFPNTGWDKSPHGSSTNTDYNKAHVSFAQASGIDPTSKVSFDALNDYPTIYDGKLTTGNFLGRTSATATFAGGLESSVGKYFTILPYEIGANLMLRIKYTLVSNDGYGETIEVDNASAVIPAELARWSPNYAYTYIFKIGDMTNGSTGVDGDGNVITGLTPITLDAVVVDGEEGVQETITTVSTPSITTYSAGKVITANDEYKKDKTIYIIVNNGTSNVALGKNTDTFFYTATIQSGAAQTITEATVENAIKNGTYNSSAHTYTVTDANGKNLVVTESDLLTVTNQIPAEDSPTGNIINIGNDMVAKFTPTTSGNFAFRYDKAAVAAVYYTQEEADEHNAELDGALNSTTPLTSEQATNYNNAITGASKVEGNTLLTAEAAAYNATLDGAWTTETIKTPAIPAVTVYKVIKVVE